MTTEPLSAQLEQLAAGAGQSKGLERIVDLASIGDLVCNNLPQIIAALKAKETQDG